ncbi:MAG TPA: hypothetical protein VFI41_04925 [Gemmatimonadales bacterium]|nr:hypothetical protein [Gemmatimonadales bacterium]
MTAAFFDFEEVLARQTREPLALGLKLVRLVRPAFRLILSTEETQPELVQHWLLENALPRDTFAYQYHLLPDELELSEDEVFERHLDRALVHINIEMVVTASPTRAAIAMRRSITALLFASPATARPEFRPGLRPWDEISEEVSRRRILRAKATVGNADDD